MKKVTLIVAAACLATASYAQKAKVSSAKNMLILQRYDEAKTTINEAIANEKTANFAGTYTIAAGAWQATGDKKDTAFGNIENVTADDTKGKTCEYQRLLIPTTEDFTVSCTIELWNDNGAAADVKLSTEDKTFTVTQDLEKGNAYDFNLSLSVGELIEFTVTQKPTWTPATGPTDVTL